MEFSTNHPIIYAIVGVIILVVLAQSVYFLVRAVNRAKQKGMDMSIIKKTISSAAMDLTAEERATIHGNNERVRLDCANRAVEFYIRLIKQC